MYKNIQQAMEGQLTELAFAPTVTIKGQKTKELIGDSFAIEDPTQLLYALAKRTPNVFAQVAETLWMLAGRNDMKFLTEFIPQAGKWSDDGKVWRGAYGPKLRDWEGIDQIRYVLRTLQKDPYSRQAVISLWDPASDTIEVTKDRPCNNQLQFLLRDNMLHLVVTIRSNDAIYGFGHIDFYGWAVLQNLMASWLGVKVGPMYWNTGSFHIYEKHFNLLEDEDYLIRWSTDHVSPLGMGITYKDLFHTWLDFDSFNVELYRFFDLWENDSGGFIYWTPAHPYLRMAKHLFMLHRAVHDAEGRTVSLFHTHISEVENIHATLAYKWVSKKNPKFWRTTYA